MSEEDETNSADRKTRKLGMAGSKIAHYTLIRELGHGGQGYVYLARDEILQRDVALKILHNMSAMNPKTRLRFVREAETASKLTHPGLCAVHEFGEYEGMPFIAMQYVEGTPLSDKISTAKESAKTENASFVAFDTTTSAGVKEEKKATDTGRGSNAKTRQGSSESPQDRDAIMKVMKMIEDTARALHAAHEESLIHRDIKPANIILAHDGRPVILDFGLARDEESDHATLTMTGDLMGTPAYMSPEQITRSSIRVDRRSDVYSLGVTLFECLTLERPFAAPNREKLYQAIMFDSVPNPRKLNPAIPDDVRVIIEMALEKSPDRRYQTAEEFAEDLRRVREYKPIHAKPAGPWVKTVRWVQRNPAVAAASMVVFLALIAVAGVFYVKEGEASKSRDKALLARKDAEAARDEAQTARDLARTESKQKTIALAAEKKEREAKQSALEAEQKERRAKEKALGEKEAALTEKSLALANYDRLADVKKLEKAQAASDLLYPSSPELVEKILAWQEKHGALASRLPGHKEFLETLRSKALPYTEENRKRDFAPEIAALAQSKKSLQKLEAELLKAEDGKAKDKLLATKKNLEKQTKELTATIAGRRSWDFGDRDDLLLQHDIISELVSKLESFANDEQGPVKSIAERLKTSRAIASKTLNEQNEAWVLCRDRIKKNKIYDGLDLKPQLGLIPLGPDPASGLEEFLHYLSHKGSVPGRNKDGKIAVTEDLGVILVLIPGGTFKMGSQKEDPKKPNYNPGSQDDEGPVHDVKLKAYFLAKYEMTQAQWQRCFAINPSSYGPGTGQGDSRFKAPVNWNHPVEQISWHDCQKFLPRIGLLLPTEAEWERAARARGEDLVFAGTSRIEELAKYANINGSETKAVGFSNQQPGHMDDYILHAPVGSYAANAFGLHDMTGNVWEWCFDTFFGYGTQAGKRGIRGKAGSSALRVYRGGSFITPAAGNRFAHRNTNTPESRYNNLGVRASRIVTF